MCYKHEMSNSYAKMFYMDAYMMIVYDRPMRTTISIDDHLFATAKKQASQAGLTFSSYLEQLLRASLAQHSPRKKHPPFRLVTVRGELVQPALDLDRTSALLTAEDEEFYANAGR